jgi:hypothetical protein
VHFFHGANSQIYKSVHGKKAILQRYSYWTHDSVLIFAVVSIYGLILGTLRWTLTQQPEKHSRWIYFLYFLRFWDRLSSKPWTGFDLNLAVKFLTFSQIIFSWCWHFMYRLQIALMVRENSLLPWKMWNPIVQCRNQLCPLRMALSTRLSPPIRWKWTLISPNPV